jgi:hypothetical protein
MSQHADIPAADPGRFFLNATSSDSGSGDNRTRILWGSYDVDIVVSEDGNFHVTERQNVQFKGAFSEGYACIPLDRVESISNVQVMTESAPEDSDNHGYLSNDEADAGGEMVRGTKVSEDTLFLDPGQYRVLEENGELLIEYGFESTSSSAGSVFAVPQARTIILEYDVAGAIRDYPDAQEPWQQLHWMAISDEVTEVADIQQATVTVTLPQDIEESQLAFAPDPQEVSPGHLTWTRSSMDEGDAFDVQVAFPAMISATAPEWQVAADQRDAAIEDAENQNALASVMLISARILVAVGGSLFLLYAWYTGIREPSGGLVPDLISQPPDGLPAGLVGALVDEEVQPRDIAATIMDLDRRGIVRIQEGKAEEGVIFGRNTRYSLELLQPIETAQPHERVVLRNIFRSNPIPTAVKPFTALRPLFGAHRQEIQQAMDEELVRRGYLVEMPEVGRKRWQRSLKILLTVSAALAVGILVWTRTWTALALVPPVLGAAIYLLGSRLPPSIARKTADGIEASGKWKAFQQYLESSGGSVFGGDEAAITERHIPWVVAFGMDHRWLGHMNSPVPAAASSPLSVPSGPSTGGAGSDWHWGSGSPGSLGRSLRPVSPSISPTGWGSSRWSDMQGGSNSALRALSGGSDSLLSMLGDAMEAMGSSSGGGSGGSSGSSRRSSSFGGRSRSSSGGSRGFR